MSGFSAKENNQKCNTEKNKGLEIQERDEER